MPFTAPGPSGPQFLRQLRFIQRDPLSFLWACARDYGPVVQFPAGPLNVFSLNTPEGAKHILQDNAARYSKDTIQFNTLALVTGQGLLTSEGAFWLGQRRLIQPAFHRQRLAGFGEVMVQCAQRQVGRWMSGPDASVIDVDAAMMRLTLEIVGRTLFSADLSEAANDLVQAVLTALDYIIYRARSPLALPIPWPTPRNRAFEKARRVLDRAVEALIASRRAGAQSPPDLLSLLLAARSESGVPMTDGQLRDELVTLIIAGHETVASALTWIWHLLAQNPEAERRVQAEIDQVLGGRAPTLSDVERLPYVRAVFDEALRLYPPAWLITRRALAPDQVAGHAIPAGALVIISPYVIQRQAAWWPEPAAFRPERFLGERDLPPYAYLPFGGGPRLCIGNAFARMEGVLVLATLAGQFQLQSMTTELVQAEPLVTLRPRGGLRMTLRRRGNAAAS